MPVFTSNLAAEAGKRSGEVRRQLAVERKARLKELAELAKHPLPERPKEPAEPQPEPVKEAVERQLELVAEQIARTRMELNDDRVDYCEHCKRSGMQPQHRAQLLRALDDMLDRQRVLLGIPMPGNLRPQSPPKAKRLYTSLPNGWSPPTSQHPPQAPPPEFA